jgi:glutamate-1-semialdehyde aminotransferase
LLRAPGWQDRVMIDRDRLRLLHTRERERFVAHHPASAALFARASEHMPHGVPMSWMAKWPGDFPVFVDRAAGAHFTDADGLDYIDFCLGDTGAMAGHSPAQTVAAVTAALPDGITTMLPGAAAIEVSGELSARFGLPSWQFTLSATDANRHVIRYARALTGRGRIVVHDFCYHGYVD